MFGILLSGDAFAMKSADPWLNKVAGEVSHSLGSEQEIEWDIDVWMGRDVNKFWLKTEGSYSTDESNIETANLELVYSKAISPYWDQQFGLRHDVTDSADNSTRNWVSYGYIGTAPYFIEVDARVFVGEESSSQFFLEAQREFMLNQRWVITTELDLIVNGHSNQARKEGSGLAQVSFEIRLGYEPSRKFQPFVAFGIEQNFGQSKRFIKQAGGESGDFKTLFGIEAWY